MKTKKEPKEKPSTLVVVDHSLDKFKDAPLFPKKVEKANETLKKVGLPKPLATGPK
jgi:hypothetical protein